MYAKRNLKYIRTVLIAVLSMLALSSVAAGSAQAKEWYVNYKPLGSKYQLFLESSGSSITLTSNLGYHIDCNPSLAQDSGAQFATGPWSISQTWPTLHNEDRLTGCQVRANGTNILWPCEQEGTTTFHWMGNEEIAGDPEHVVPEWNEAPYLRWKKGSGCPIPLKLQLSIPELKLTYGNQTEEAVKLPVWSSGTGTYGAQTMSISGFSYWTTEGGKGGLAGQLWTYK